MSNGIYVGVGDVAHKMTGGYVGVDGIARKIQKVYVGVGGKAQLAWQLKTKAMPTKGDIIVMNLDGTDREYRVIKVVDKNTVEVMMMWDYNTEVFGNNNTYSGSTIDDILNGAWYTSLTSEAKNAIVPKTITQDSWYWGTSGSPQYSGTYGTTAPGSTSYTFSKGSDNYAAIGERYVYALSMQEVLDYLNDESVLVDTSGMLRNQNIWKMFWNQTSNISVYIWLRSARADNSNFAWLVSGSNGYVNRNSVGNPGAVRGALQIDLSKISYTIIPQKGEIILLNLDGTEREYRVIKNVSGSTVEVMTMWNISTSTAFDSNNTNTYAGKTLDTYLNTTWYNTLSTTAKAAIVPKNVNQYQYTYSTSVYNETTHSSYADYSTKALKANVGERYVYALDVEDIEMYFGGTGGSASDKTPATFSKTDLLQMFWNRTSTISEYPWLRSASASYSNRAWCMYGSNGRVNHYNVRDTYAVRGVLQIDLSKIDFSYPPPVS